MIYKYKLTDEGRERVFPNTTKIDENTLESDHELFSPFLELIEDTTAPETQQPSDVTLPQPTSEVTLDDEPKQETN